MSVQLTLLERPNVHDTSIGEDEAITVAAPFSPSVRPRAARRLHVAPCSSQPTRYSSAARRRLLSRVSRRAEKEEEDLLGCWQLQYFLVGVLLQDCRSYSSMNSMKCAGAYYSSFILMISTTRTSTGGGGGY